MPDRAANEPAEFWLPDGHVAFYFSSGSPSVAGVLLRRFPCVKVILGPAVSYRGFRCKPYTIRVVMMRLWRICKWVLL